MRQGRSPSALQLLRVDGRRPRRGQRIQADIIRQGSLSAASIPGLAFQEEKAQRSSPPWTRHCTPCPTAPECPLSPELGGMPQFE